MKLDQHRRLVVIRRLEPQELDELFGAIDDAPLGRVGELTSGALDDDSETMGELDATVVFAEPDYDTWLEALSVEELEELEDNLIVPG